MTTYTVETRALLGMFAKVLPFAGTDDTLPTLTCIEFGAGDGYLTATTCDRYRLAHARTKLADRTVPDFTFLLRARDAKRIAELFKVPKDGYGGELAVAVRPGEISVSGGNGLALTITAPDFSDFITWRPLLAGALAAIPAPGPFAVNPRYLADFAVLYRAPFSAVRITMSNPDKPVLIEAEDFVGALMPVKLEVLASVGFDVMTGDEPTIGVILTPPKVRARKATAAMR